MGIDTEYDDDALIERIQSALSQVSGDRSNQSIIIDNGKYVAAVVICAALCGMAMVYAYNANQKATDAITEYRVMLNHQMEMDAQLKELQRGK